MQKEKSTIVITDYANNRDCHRSHATCNNFAEFETVVVSLSKLKLKFNIWQLMDSSVGCLLKKSSISWNKNCGYFIGHGVWLALFLAIDPSGLPRASPASTQLEQCDFV